MPMALRRCTTRSVRCRRGMICLRFVSQTTWVEGECYGESYNTLRRICFQNQGFKVAMRNSGEAALRIPKPKVTGFELSRDRQAPQESRSSRQDLAIPGP